MTIMKISKRDLALLMVLFGIMAAFCSYKFYFSPTLETVEAEKAKQAELQVQLDEILKVAGTENQMSSEVKKWESEISKTLEGYKVFYTVEDGILWMKDIETGNLDAENGTSVLIKQYTVGEPNVSNTVTGQGSFTGKEFQKGSTNYSFSYEVTNYAAMKKLIDYIVSGNDGVKTLDSMSFAVNKETGVISGNITMTVYTMSDGTVAYTAPVIDGVTLGAGDIFGDIDAETK